MPDFHFDSVLITGANGEFGHALIRNLADAGCRDITALDRRPLDAALRPLCASALSADICDADALAEIFEARRFSAVFHLAALLSTEAERTPELAHEVNVTGTLNLLRLSREYAAATKRTTRFIFPSSIAVYGLPSLEAKAAAGAVDEMAHLEPATMYGTNKLACEHLGRYYARHYRQLSDRPTSADAPAALDFRCIRFPGVISAFTLPTGGTSDYAPEMLHAAARGEAYRCFVRETSRIPFMAMPDAVDAMLKLAAAPRERLSRCVYNIAAFNPSAGEIAALVREAFPGAAITFEPDQRRQAIVDTWPEDVDDSQARRDWGYAPSLDLASAFGDYLIPNVVRRYES